MKHIKTFEQHNTNEDFFNFKKLTDEDRFEKALNNAKPIFKINYEQEFDDVKKRKFFDFVKKNGFKIPAYIKYVNDEFVDSSVNVGNTLLSAGSGGKHN